MILERSPNHQSLKKGAAIDSTCCHPLLLHGRSVAGKTDLGSLLFVLRVFVFFLGRGRGGGQLFSRGRNDTDTHVMYGN